MIKADSPLEGTVDPIEIDAIHSRILDQILADPQLPCHNDYVPLWQEPNHPTIATKQSETLPETTDFAVVGSGISALGVVKHLLEDEASQSKSVTVFEARGICSGATGRNGGQLTRVPTTRYTKLLRNFGREQADKITRFTIKTLKAMQDLCESDEELKAFTEIQPLQKVFVMYDQQSFDEAKASYKTYIENLPEEDGLWTELSTEDTRGPKYNLRDSYGGYTFSAAVCWPYRLITGVFEKLGKTYGNRLNIEAFTPVNEVKYDPASNAQYPYIVESSRGVTRAANVIHCTNGYAGHLLPLMRGRMYPRRGTMSTQKPGSLFADVSKLNSWTFHYEPTYDPKTQLVETGRYYGFQYRGSGELWIGGDHEKLYDIISSDDSAPAPDAEEVLSQLLPRLFTDKWVSTGKDPTGKDGRSVRLVWSGVMCYTGDGLPFVGRLPAVATGRAESPAEGTGEWIAGGYNTYGMANGLLCGKALAKMALGKGDEVKDFFPEAYLPTEERLQGERMISENVATDFMYRVGVKHAGSGSEVITSD